MKIAFIVQRYGADILGGSEYHCRLIAERMAQRHQVDVLTTCARDYITWKNEYPEGVDRVRGVTVRRFPNAQLRDLESFNRYSDRIFNYPHTDADELEWLKQQGPWCPALIEYLERQQRQYDVLIFFTYLYAPTVLGMKVNPAKSILVPTAHDEPAIRLRIYKELFTSARDCVQHRLRAPLPELDVRDSHRRGGNGRLRRRPARRAVRTASHRPRTTRRSHRAAAVTIAARASAARAVLMRVRMATTIPSQAPATAASYALAARPSAAVIASTIRSCCTAAASIRARAAKSCSSISTAS